MKKSKIEWTDYALNPIKGLCPVDCKDNQGKSYCYARRMYKRFRRNPEIEWCPRVFRELDKLKSGSRVFVGSTIELFGDWVKDIWFKLILEEVVLHSNLTFIFLTKRPENLIKWSPFPENCWVGVSITHSDDFLKSIYGLYKVKASLKFISFEPLLYWAGYFNTQTLADTLHNYGIGQIIIGQQTPVKLSTMPKIGWVEEIVTAADKAGIPVFLKDNLISCVDQYEFALKDGKYRQEFP